MISLVCGREISDLAPRRGHSACGRGGVVGFWACWSSYLPTYLPIAHRQRERCRPSETSLSLP
jgi:hypothetical protein